MTFTQTLSLRDFKALFFAFITLSDWVLKILLPALCFAGWGFHSKTSYMLPKCPTREPHHQVCFCYGVYSFMSIGYLHVWLQFRSHLRTLGSCLFSHFPWKHNAKQEAIAYACSTCSTWGRRMTGSRWAWAISWISVSTTAVATTLLTPKQTTYLQCQLNSSSLPWLSLPALSCQTPINSLLSFGKFLECPRIQWIRQ